MTQVCDVYCHNKYKIIDRLKKLKRLRIIWLAKTNKKKGRDAIVISD